MSQKIMQYVMSWGMTPSSTTAGQIPVKEVRKHPAIKELLVEAKRLDHKVIFGKNRKWFLGTHEKRRNLITVQLCDPMGTPFDIEDIAFILAHEIRHAQHVEQKLYSEYYRAKRDGSWQIGLWAERNCDAFATKFCGERGLNSYLCGRKYPGWKVCLRNPPRKWKRERILTRIIYQDMIDMGGSPWEGRYQWLLTRMSFKFFSQRAPQETPVMTIVNP